MTSPRHLTIVGEELWKRIGNSMDRVEQRLRRTNSILESSGGPSDGATHRPLTGGGVGRRMRGKEKSYAKATACGSV